MRTLSENGNKGSRHWKRKYDRIHQPKRSNSKQNSVKHGKDSAQRQHGENLKRSQSGKDSAEVEE